VDLWRVLNVTIASMGNHSPSLLTIRSDHPLHELALGERSRAWPEESFFRLGPSGGPLLLHGACERAGRPWS